MTGQRKTIKQGRGQETRILAAANAFTARHFRTPELARKWLEIDSLAQWASMLALRRHKLCLQDQEARLVSLRRKEMPQGFQCDHRYGHGA